MLQGFWKVIISFIAGELTVALKISIWNRDSASIWNYFSYFVNCIYAVRAPPNQNTMVIKEYCFLEKNLTKLFVSETCVCMCVGVREWKSENVSVRVCRCDKKKTNKHFRLGKGYRYFHVDWSFSSLSGEDGGMINAYIVSRWR